MPSNEGTRAAFEPARHRCQHARRAARLAGDPWKDGGVRLDADSGPAELPLEVPRVRVGDAIVAAQVDERAVPACSQGRRTSLPP